MTLIEEADVAYPTGARRHVASAKRHNGSTFAAALMLLATSCASSDTTQSQERKDSSHTDASVSFTNLFIGYSTNEPLYETTDQLAEHSEVVVTGTIVSIDLGRTMGLVGEPDVPNFHTLLMHIAVDDVYVGRLTRNSIDVELPAPGRIPAETFDAAVPEATRVVLYLYSYSPDSPGDSDYVVDFGETWPADDSVYWPTNSQGFMLLEEGSVTAPLGGPLTYGSGTTLTEFLPDAGRLPKGRTAE